MLIQVALVSQTGSVSLADLVKVSAALQKQVSRDFAPIWKVNATVDSFATLGDVPLGYWPVILRDDVATNYKAAGIHLDKTGQPFALVQASKDWALTSSHEVLEMLADPFGDRLVAGAAPPEAKGQKRVEYLVEVCDPSEDARFGYTVNDILLSDFYTPNFFDPVANKATRYSFTGAISKPRTILKNGYISWHNPVNDHWYQLRWFGTAKPTMADLGVFSASSMSTREWIDGLTQTPAILTRAREKAAPAAMGAVAMVRAAGTPAAAGGRAAMIEDHIAQLLAAQ
jgi:hypothetical protein